MRILRGLSSRFLPCGCLVGVYETYDSEIVSILDARSSSCVEVRHQVGKTVPVEQSAAIAGALPGLDAGTVRWD
jgi:hypothetical protein